MTQPPVPPAAGPPWPNNSAPLPPTRPPRPKRTPWIILGGALVVVIALVVGIVLWKSGSSGNAGDSSNIAGGGGDRTVGLLREEDPVCADWLKYADELAEKTKDWSEIDKAIPASAWTPQQKAIVDDAVGAITTAADRFESILPNAKNVVLQELIAQTVVYWRAYLEKVPNYIEADSLISGVAGNFGNAVNYMCGSVLLIASNFSVVQQTSSNGDPSRLVPLMRNGDGSCGAFKEVTDERDLLLGGWLYTDPAIPASDWSNEQREVNMAAKEVLSKLKDKVLQIARRDKNPVFSDLLVTYSAYIAAYAEIIPRYKPDDNQLWRASIAISGGLNAACEASL